jgi:hypothetical protein
LAAIGLNLFGSPSLIEKPSPFKNSPQAAIMPFETSFFSSSIHKMSASCGVRVAANAWSSFGGSYSHTSQSNEHERQ